MHGHLCDRVSLVPTGWLSLATSHTADTQEAKPTRAIDRGIQLRQVLEPDAIPSIEGPTFGTAYIGDLDDRVLALDGDPPRAYPFRIPVPDTRSSRDRQRHRPGRAAGCRVTSLGVSAEACMAGGSFRPCLLRGLSAGAVGRQRQLSCRYPPLSPCCTRGRETRGVTLASTDPTLGPGDTGPFNQRETTCPARIGRPPVTGLCLYPD